MCQIASGVYTQESANAICDLLNVATHVVAIDAFANDLTLAFLKFYRDENVRVIDNKYQLRKKEIVKFLYNSNKGSEGIRRGFKMLQEEAGIFFEISGYFDAVIGITNITTSVYVDVFAQILFRICNCSLYIVSLYHSKKFDIFKELCQELIRAELSVLKSGDLLTIIKGHLIASTEAILKLILVEDTKKINRNKISYIIKNTEEKIKDANAESIANTPDISPNKAEIFKQNSIYSFANNITLQCHYLWRIYASDDIDFIKRYNNPEPLQHFRRLAYFRRQGSNSINSIENLKINEEMQWEDSHESMDLFLVDLHKFYSAKHRDSFVTQKEIIAIKMNNSKYFPIGSILPLYKPELIDETQNLFDSIPITNNITSEYTKHEVSDLFNNKIDEKDLFLEMLAQYDAEHRKNSFQDICHVDIITFEANAYEKEIFDSLISLSSEFLIKSEFDVDMLIFYLQQKFQISQEKLEQ
ncbi:5668_t:CDS:2 [Scutellospora calospora]|uniref:5668_t:CDS:1 n=1 Tax=Scutellospora calospora TaxID=85575 RepID=A0ACA9K983_9GLOM|nr:5668_t:CDS:2 [Scutellospora calospora]